MSIFEKEIERRLENNEEVYNAYEVLASTDFHYVSCEEESPIYESIMIDDYDWMSGATKVYILFADFHYVSCEEESPIYESIMIDDYYWMSGATKVCILFDDFVLKTLICGEMEWNEETGTFEEIDCGDTYDDFCRIEYQVYQRAVIEGVSQFFAETIYLGDSVYAQQRSEGDVCDIETEVEDEELTVANFVNSTCKALGIEKLPTYFDSDYYLVKCFFDHYSDLEMVQLYNFLKKYDINDLHDGNVGVYNGKPMIYDFSGYLSCTSERIKKSFKTKI